jgi:hypothetical protein
MEPRNPGHRIPFSIAKTFGDGDGLRYSLTNGRRGRARYQERILAIDDSWTVARIRSLLLEIFPKMETNPTQKKRAGIWAYIIYKYWITRVPASQIAADKNMPLKLVERTIDRIKKASAGLRTDGEPRVGKMGRPKKSVVG